MTSDEAAKTARQAASPTRDGRRERILAAAGRLFAERGFHNVAVRDVAAEAGVTHPLIYYYWPSKDGLLAEVIARGQHLARDMARGGNDPLDLAEAIGREYMRSNREYLLTITRAFLDGMQPSEWPGGFPGVDALLVALGVGAGAPHSDSATTARERVAVVTAMLNGWSLIEDQLLEIVGLPAEDREHARDTLARCMREVLAPTVRDS